MTSKQKPAKRPQPRPVAVRRLAAAPVIIDDHDDAAPTVADTDAPAPIHYADHREELDHADDAAAAFLAAVGSNTAGRITAYRITGGLKRYLPESFEAQGFDLSKLHNVYGGGDFLLELRIGGQIRSKARVTIEGEPRTPAPPPSTVPAAPTDPAAAALAAIAARLERIEQRAAAPHPAADPLDQMQKLAAILAALRPAGDSLTLDKLLTILDRRPTPASELVELVKLSRQVNNGPAAQPDDETDDDAGTLGTLATAAGRFVAGIMQKPAAAPHPQQQQPTPPALPAPPPSSADAAPSSASPSSAPAAATDPDDLTAHPMLSDFTPEQREAVADAIDALDLAARRKTPAPAAAAFIRATIGADAANLAALGADGLCAFVAALAPDLDSAYVRSVAEALTSKEPQQ